MATFVNDLRLKEIATGDESGTWGTSTNTNLELIGEAMGLGAETIPNASTHTITMADGTSDEFRSLFLRLTGGGTACTVTLAPNTLSHTWIMRNETSAALTLTQGSGANVTIAAGQTKIVATDGGGSGAIVYEMDDLELAGNLTVDTTTLVVDATNNRVGIGTSSPATALDVTGNVTASGTLQADRITANGAGSSNYAVYGLQNGSMTHAGYFQANGDDIAIEAIATGGTYSSDVLYVRQSSLSTGGNLARFANSTGDKVVITTAGNVGIGNSSPLGNLTISNAAGANAPTTVTAANTYLQLGSDDYGPSNNGKFMIGFGYTDATNTNSPAYIGFEETSSSGDTKGELTFYTRDVTTDTAPTERMRIDSSGNVGIGVTDPSNYYAEHLVVAATDEGGITIVSDPAHQAYLMFADGTSGNASYRGYVGYDHDSDTMNIVSNGVARFYSGNPTTERMRITSSGQVKIANGGSLNFDAASNGNFDIAYKASDNTFNIINNSSSAAMGFHTSSTERMRIDSSGNLLVGTTSTGLVEGLYVAKSPSNVNVGVARFDSTRANDESYTVASFVKNSATTNTSQVFIIFAISGYNSACGQINANGAGQAAFGVNSDRRLKENITDLPNQLANITALRPVEFDYIESEGGGHQTGFIAQEVEEIYPDLVGERHDGMKTLTGISKMEARLIKAIQEQQALIESLTARITQLENN